MHTNGFGDIPPFISNGSMKTVKNKKLNGVRRNAHRPMPVKLNPHSKFEMSNLTLKTIPQDIRDLAERSKRSFI